MKSRPDLTSLLHRLDGRSYKAYKDLRGEWRLDGVTLFVDRVQGDPFAAPSRVRLRVSLDDAGIPAELHASPVRAVALRDALARAVADAIALRSGERRGSGKSGLVSIDDGRQTVLERSAVVLGDGFVEARLEIGLPAAGRRILGREAEALLCDTLPALVDAGLRWDALPQRSIRSFVACIENQEHLRGQLEARGLVAFVANGALLPRRAGDSDLPMRESDCVAFESPPSLEVELELLHPEGGDVDDPPTTIRGMGVPRGVTLIVGGGYHGKSTLLQAIERCVHPHVPGDGREYVVAAPDLVKVRADDGRPVTGVDLRPFIGSLPAAGPSGARSTECFTTSDASGSTSQAASIIEAIEAGATGLLLDEDTCATNFMLRDARMQA
ncbi:MAG: ABC-ATPase domain-containing protein, partial [Actinomycetota bacterium]|nr:ABC-ATPase domain-containing protein [Actinomycetota bacterium]